jgi:hypothetical protein
MPDTTTPEQHHPFNPDLPKLFANYETWWNTILEEKDETFPLFEFFLPLDDEKPYPSLTGINVYVKGWHTITSGHLLELVRRDAFAEKTRLELAEKCATYRAQNEEARAKLDSSPAAIEVTYAHQTYIFSNVKRIESRSDIWPGAHYSLERACLAGVLTIVPGCVIRTVTQAELDQIHGEAAQRAEEADIMRSAGAFDPDYGKDLDED